MARKKILIVDDELGVGESFRMLLKDNYEVLDGRSTEAVKILQENRPDVILLDLLMPQMNGIEVLKDIKQTGSQVPIIVTAIKSTDTGKKCMELGAFGYITKPFDIRELLGLIHRALALHPVILVVDDELGVRESFRLVLKDNYDVLTAVNGQDALRIVEEQYPSMVLLDVRMPDMDGIEVLKRIKDIRPHLPVIVLTGVGTHRIAIETIKLGASDFIVKPVNAVHLRKVVEETLARRKEESFVNAPPSSVEEEILKRHYFNSLKSLLKVIESRDPYTTRHSEQVAKYAVKIARVLGLSDEEIEIMEQAALLHDLGKIGVRDSILHKPGKLDAEEWKEMKRHPQVAEEILEPFKLLHIEQAVIHYHHERFDGSGYPEGLKREDIPLYARILAVADGYEAMTSLRPYRRAFTSQEAKEELERCKGTQFDPKVVDAFLKMIEKEERQRQE